MNKLTISRYKAVSYIIYKIHTYGIYRFGLDPTSKEKLNEFLTLVPIYGWGWGVKGSNSIIETPQKCKFKLTSLEPDKPRYVGGTGIINEAEHEYNGCEFTFRLRVIRNGSFNDESLHYNIHVRNHDKDIYGYGTIAE